MTTRRLAVRISMRRDLPHLAQPKEEPREAREARRVLPLVAREATGKEANQVPLPAVMPVAREKEAARDPPLVGAKGLPGKEARGHPARAVRVRGRARRTLALARRCGRMASRGSSLWNGPNMWLPRTGGRCGSRRPLRRTRSRVQYGSPLYHICPYRVIITITPSCIRCRVRYGSC